MNCGSEQRLSLDLKYTNDKKNKAIAKGICFYNWCKNNIFFDIFRKSDEVKYRFYVKIKDNYGALIYFNLLDLDHIYVYLYDFDKSEPINLIHLGYGYEHKFKRFNTYWDVFEELLTIYYFIIIPEINF